MSKILSNNDSKTPRLGVIMDPIETINPKKDTTLRLLQKAQHLGWEIYYLELQNIYLKSGAVWGRMHKLTVHENQTSWFEKGEDFDFPLNDLDIILMRKDPPVDMDYIYTTQLLDLVEKAGTLVVNRPHSLRDVNEKLFTTWFSQCMVETLVTASEKQLLQFIAEHQKVVVKPLHGMAGQGIFICNQNDPNVNVILETVTVQGQQFCMAQRYIPEISAGDKRILLINGEPIPYALARIPKSGDFRGNLMRGAKGQGVELTKRDRWICDEVGPELKKRGLWFVGIDVIGDYLTEINVTSPTGVCELENIYSIDIAGKILDCLWCQARAWHVPGTTAAPP